MLKIGDFAKLAQVSTKTVRYYDKRGLLHPAFIDRFTGYRYYTVDQLSRLNRIMALKDLGFSLDQIGRMLAAAISLDELHGMLRLKQAELEQHISTEQARLNRLKSRLSQIKNEDDLWLSLMAQYKEYVTMEPTIVIKPAFKVVGIKILTNNKNGEIPQLWGKFLPQAAGIEGKSAEAYGMCGDMDDSGQYHYMAGYAVDGLDELPAGMESWEVAEQKYAAFECTLQTIGETYEYIFNTWLGQSGYQKTDAPDFEYYHADFDPQVGTGMSIYLPIK